MAKLAWVLFGLAVLWNIGSQRLNHRKRIHLESYAIYLLLADDIRANHKSDFERWIRQAQVSDALQLSTRAHHAIDIMAEKLAAGDPARPGSSSTLGAHVILWKTKHPDPPADQAGSP